MVPNVLSPAAIADASRLAVVVLLLVAVATGAPNAQSAAIDDEIAFLEARLSRDEADPITPTRLGHAYLRKARSGGDFSAYQRAEAVFRTALQRSPEHFGALTGLAAALSARHAFRDALDVAERAIRADPESPDGYAAAGDAALETGSLERARTMYGRVETLAPGYHASTRRANLAAASGDTKGAYAALDEAVADATARGMAAELIAWCHLRAGGLAWDHGDWPRAERSYEKARVLTPDSYVVLEHLGELRAAQGRDAEALAFYADAIARSPQPEFHQAVGLIHQRHKRTAEAARAFAQARDGFETAARQGDPGAFRPLALFCLEIDNTPAEGLVWARKDAAIRQDAVTLGVLAWALVKTGARVEARATADKAIAARPVDADTWYRAGLVSLDLGDRTAARARLERALEINPKFGSAADARGLLEKSAPGR